MVKIANLPENFFREIRKIEIYKKEQYSYSSAWANAPLNETPLIKIENIIPEEFDQNIKRKKVARSYYFDININCVINDLSPEMINNLHEMLNDKAFVVALYNNIGELLILGNTLNPMAIEVFDKLKNDNSGTDKVEIEISGESILRPQILNI